MKYSIAVKYDGNIKNLKITLDSITKQKKINLKEIPLYILCNKKGDFDIEEISSYKNKFLSVNSIFSNNYKSIKPYREILKNSNIEYLIFIDENKYLMDDSINNLLLEVENSSSEYGIWEMKLNPMDYAKDYDPLTGQVSYFNDACFCVNRRVLELFYLFDNRLKYIEKNIDFSIKLLKKGIKIKYVDSAMICEIKKSEINITYYNENYIEYENNYYLRCKYGTMLDLVKWLKYCLDFIMFNKVKPYFPTKRKLILKMIKSVFVGIIFLIEGIFNHNIKFKFYKYGYTLMRHNNKAIIYDKLKDTPLVSVLVRTCGRPNILRETLISLRNQTYPNIEIVIVEDGENISQSMIDSEFKDLNINYTCTGKKAGRCVVGNLAMKRAKGKYLNFLDDDDLFYHDHVETLVSALENNKDYRIAHSFAWQTNIVVKSINPKYEYDVTHKMLIYNKKFNRLRLWIVNYFPIQSIMFRKEIFEENGGFDLELDSMEDWELWARFGTKNDFLTIERITSLYRIIYTKEINEARQKSMEKYTPIAEKKIQENTIDGIPIKSIIRNHRDIIEFKDDVLL